MQQPLVLVEKVLPPFMLLLTRLELKRGVAFRKASHDLVPRGDDNVVTSEVIHAIVGVDPGTGAIHHDLHFDVLHSHMFVDFASPLSDKGAGHHDQRCLRTFVSDSSAPHVVVDNVGQGHHGFALDQSASMSNSGRTGSIQVDKE